ncbi:MAG TPA: response regulator [Longimicrobiaceae bacterium]|nr:response regulator [Longimicrobiaceae bacterium]
MPNVLLVDTHEDSRLIYAAAFRHHGFAVTAVASCAEMADLARAQRPALIVMGLEYPAAATWEALRALRSDGATACIPVLAVSTTGLQEHRDRALELGCAAFFTKPLPPLELLAAARGVLECGRRIAAG